jgi:uncharacterized tellurite resistance protein B-like protein
MVVSSSEVSRHESLAFKRYKSIDKGEEVLPEILMTAKKSGKDAQRDAARTSNAAREAEEENRKQNIREEVEHNFIEGKWGQHARITA